MDDLILQRKSFSKAEKIIFTIMGALLMGTMWSLRGSHGWGSEWGVFTVGLLVMTYVYAVFARKSNDSYFHIAVACASCMLTVPAWGTLLNQTSGYFENSAKEQILAETAECNSLSGFFIMLCLGIGAIPLYLFILSRLFSDIKYNIWKYVAVIAVFFGVNYLACASVSHWILNLVQPESAATFEQGLAAHGENATAYQYYMQHFASIGNGKKIDFGRNYFTEISVISKTIATIITSLVVRFGFKDKAGGRIMLFGSLSFGVAITDANIFFALKNKLGTQTFPVLDSAWGLWEYFTGFIGGLLIMIILFAVNDTTADKKIKNDFVPFIPEKVRNILATIVSFALIGMSFIRPFAVRVDENKTLSIIIYALGGVAILTLLILTLTGKICFFGKNSVSAVCSKSLPVMLALHEIAYFFVGYGEDCPPKVTTMSIVPVINAVSFAIIIILYFIKRKKITEE